MPTRQQQRAKRRIRFVNIGHDAHAKSINSANGLRGAAAGRWVARDSVFYQSRGCAIKTRREKLKCWLCRCCISLCRRENCGKVSPCTRTLQVMDKIGYPAWMMDDNKLLDRYAGLASNLRKDSYFANVFMSLQVDFKKSMREMPDAVDRSKWYMSPSDVNAYYAPSFNEIVFPAGILQPPFFLKGAGKFVNYGAIGAVIAHELTHGFDDQGRMYDGMGTLPRRALGFGLAIAHTGFFEKSHWPRAGCCWQGGWAQLTMVG